MSDHAHADDPEPGASPAQARHKPGATSASARQTGASPAQGRHEGGVSLQEAALQLDISERTIRRMLTDGELQGYKQKATRGYVWRVLLDDVLPAEPGASSAEGRHEPGTSPAAPDLMKALEIIETIRREHEETRRELEGRAEQMRIEKDAQLERLQQEASEKGDKIAELTGAAAHWQTRAILAEEQARKAEEHVKLLMAPQEPTAAGDVDQPARRSWWQRLRGR